MSKDLSEVINTIKKLVRKSAKDIITIGKVLVETKVPHGSKKMFYKEIGMSSRTAQRYKTIYKSHRVQKLLAADDLEGLNFTQLILLARDKKETKTSPQEKEEEVIPSEIDFKEEAHEIFKNYKDILDFQTLVKELQLLLEKEEERIIKQSEQQALIEEEEIHAA